MKLTIELRADGSGLTGTVRVAAAELQRLNATANGTAAAGRNASQGIKDIDRSSQSAGTSVRRLATHVNTLRGTLATLGVAFVAREFLAAGLAMTRFDNGLSAALGSQQLARQEMGFLRAEAERLGIYLPVMVQGFTGLAAATRGTALEGEKTRAIFSAVAEAGRAMNLTNDQIAGTLNALQQIAGKGTVSMEELRLQLGDRLPGAMQIAARAMGMTVGELTKLVSEGKVASEDFLPKFAAELSRSAAAGVEFAKNSPAAQFERLKTALFELAAVGSGEVLSALADGAKSLATGINDLIQSGAVATLGNLLGTLLRQTDTLLVSLTVFYGARGLGAVAVKLKELATPMLLSIAQFEELGIKAAGAAGAQKQLLSAGSALFAAMGGWVTVVAALAGGLYMLYEASEAARQERRKEITTADELIARLRAERAERELIAAGRATETNTAEWQSLEKLTKQHASYTAELARQREIMWQIATSGGERGFVAASSAVAELESLTADTNDRIVTLVSEMVRAGKEVPPAFQAMSAEAKRYGETVASVVGELLRLQSAQPGADDADFNGQSNALPKQTAGLSDAVRDQVKALEERTAALGMDTLAALENDKANALRLATNEEDRIGLTEAWDALIKKTAATEAATEAERSSAQALREQQQAMQANMSGLSQALAGYDDWQRALEDLEAELAGPMAQAQLDYDRALIAAEADAAKLGLTAEELARQKKALREEFERTVGAIEDERDVLGNLEDDYAEQIRLARLSESERRIEIASLQAIAQWRNTHEGAIDAETEARIRQMVQTGEAELDLIDAAQQHAEEYQRAWEDAINGVGEAFGDWIANGMDDFDDFGDALVDTAKRLVAQLIAEFAKVQIAQMFAGAGGSLGAAVQSFTGGGGSSLGGNLLSSFSSGGAMNTFLTSWARGRGFETASSFVGPPEALSGGASGTASGMQIGAQALGGTMMGFGLGRAIGGVRGGNAGAALGALGSLAGPIGSMIGSVLGGIIGGLTSKPDDLRLGASGQSRKPETSFETVFGTMDLGTRGPLGGYHDQIISAVQDFDALLAGVVGAFDANGTQMQAIKDKLSTWAVDLKGDSATVEEALGQRLTAILSTFSADVQQFVGSAGTLEERTQRLADALAIEAAVDAGTLGDTFATVADLLTDMQLEGEQLTDTYARVVASVEMLRDASELMGVQLDLGTEQFARFAAEITEAAGGLERAQALWANYFDRFYTDNELLAMQSSGANAAAQSEFSDIGLSVGDFTGEGGAAAFRALFEEQLPTLSAEAVVQWLEAAAALGVVIDLQTQQNTVLQEQADALAEYNGLVAGLRDELDATSMSDFALEMRDIQRWTAETTASLNTAARAAGMQAANEEDLGLVHQIAAQRAAAAIERLRSSAADLVAKLYGSPLDTINEQIAAMEAAQHASIESVGNAAQDMYAAQLAALQGIQAWLNSQLLGDLSTLTPEAQLAEARRQFEATLALAQGGDVDALQRITGEADTLLRMGRDYYASGQQYTDLEALVRGGLGGLVNAGPTGAQLGGQNNVGGGGGVSPELQALYEERDAAMLAAEQQHRAELLDQLGSMIHELIQATGQPLAEVASSIGLNLRDLAADLGINLNELSAETASSLVDMARALGVDVAELATNVGVSLGNLGDRQSLLNQALDRTLVDIPEEFRNQLAAPLEAIRSATTEADATAAVNAAEVAINGMPAGIRDLLAPYFANVFPAESVTELTRLSDIASTSAASLGVLQTIAGIMSAQAAAPKSGTSAGGDASGNQMPDMSAAYGELAAAMASAEAAQSAALDGVADSIGEAARMLGADVSDLAEGVGLALVGLADRQTLLNQDLMQTLLDTPAALREQLYAPLDAIRSATIEIDANAAIALADSAIRGLPLGIAETTAPFVEAVLAELSSLNATAAGELSETAAGNVLLGFIRGGITGLATALLKPPAPKSSSAATAPPAYAAGGWVNGPTTLLAGEAGRELILPNPVSEFLSRAGIPINTGGDSRAVVAELRALRESNERTQRELINRVEQLERAQRDGAERIARETQRQTDVIATGGR